MKRFFIVLSLSLLSSTLAQDLARLLPSETFFALGVQDWASHQDKLQPYIDEFNRLELGQAFMKMADRERSSENGSSQTPITDAARAQDDVVKQWQETFGDINLLDIVGQEAWISLSASRSNPIPGMTLLSKLSPAAASKFQQVITEESAQAETLTEGNFNFYVLTDNSSEAFNTVAYSLQNDILMLSTNPDVLRGLLRQLGGSKDPNFTSSALYAQTLGQYSQANAYGYLDFSAIIKIAAPFARQTGFNKLVDRLVKAFETAGVSAGVSRFTDTGIETQGFQAINPKGGDTSLTSLLTRKAVADQNRLQSVPANALSVSISHADLKGWWGYLNEIASSQPELGGDLDSILLSFGLDLKTSFFNWVGDQVATITTGVTEAVEPGMPASNLLGEIVYIFEATDESAAENGIGTLIQTISGQVAAFADPSGGMGNTQQTTEDLSGIKLTTLNVTSGVSLSYAVNGGKAMLATSKESLRKVLESQNTFTNLEEVQGLLALIPEDASSFTLSNDRASLEGSAGQIRSSVQMVAGLGGAAGLDFEATDALAGKLEEYLSFIASRMGYSMSYSQQEAQGVRSYGKSFIMW